ncbi:MAG: GNAT family N-acetyltransferase [Bacteroidetes bacterium]|nr:GNAT family N-acetyltransferase [Bacteroidota bacterium]
MESGHFPFLKEFWEKTDGINLTIGDTPEEIESYLKRNKGMSFICKEGDALAGTILCGHDGRRGFIYHLAVSRDHRNKNIASALIELSLEKLRSAGIRRCMIMVDEVNLKAKSFWLKMNWRRRDDLKMFSLDL